MLEHIPKPFAKAGMSQSGGHFFKVKEKWLDSKDLGFYNHKGKYFWFYLLKLNYQSGAKIQITKLLFTSFKVD